MQPNEFPPQDGTGAEGPTECGSSVPSLPPLGLQLSWAADRELEAEDLEDEAALRCPECGRRWGCRCQRVRDASFDLND